MNINIEDIEFVNETGGIYYVFWHHIYVGSIEQIKKKKYMPPELVGKWEAGYTSNDFYETRELAAISRVKKYLKRNPDKIDGANETDLKKTAQIKAGLDALKKMRQGDYGPGNNVIKQEFGEWCNANNIEDEKFKSKAIEDYMLLVLDMNTWPVTQENLQYAQYIKRIMSDFIKHILLRGISIRTYRQRLNSLSALGTDILRNRASLNSDTPQFKELFLQDIEKTAQNPPDYGYVDKDGHDKKFRCDCKKFIEYITQA